MQCNPCKKSTTGMRGSIVFKCPSCLKYDIARCPHCREIVAKYKCPACGFEGPN